MHSRRRSSTPIPAAAVRPMFISSTVETLKMSNILDYSCKPIVMVTGFGPFPHCPVNASWEGVKLMNKDEIEKKHNIKLLQFVIPVIYETVDEWVPALWEIHEPKLVIHVGVSEIADKFTLELQANREGYQYMDTLNKRPVNQTCLAEGAIQLHTKLNVEKICKQFNDFEIEMEAVSSSDAGSYLCEYIYYTSLSVDNARTLFIHVPENSIYSSKEIARGLEKILDLGLEQIKVEEVRG